MAFAPSEPLAVLELWHVPTAWGEFCAAVTREGALAALAFPAKPAGRALKAAAQSARSGHPAALFIEKGEMPRRAAFRRQLTKYIDGGRGGFDLPLALGRRAEFSIAVWRAAAAIPHGQRRSYGDLARRIGRPKAARAVGQALGRNPVPLAAPCHRVVRSDGSLGGFSGGEGWKERLLAFEACAPRGHG